MVGSDAGRSLRIGLVGPDATGHLNPLTALGQALAQRGHRPVVIGGRAAEPFAIRSGLDFAAVGVGDGLDDRFAEELRRLGEAEGAGYYAQLARCGRLGSQILQRDLDGALDRSGVDALIVDQYSPAALDIAERRGLGVVFASCALGVWWQFPAPDILDTETVGPVRRAMRFGLDAAYLGARVAHEARHRLNPSAGPRLVAFDRGNALAWVAQQPPWFDAPDSRPPSDLIRTGPWHAPGSEASSDFPWHRLDGRPLVYASFGTLHSASAGRLDMVVEALSSLDVQLILSRGGGTADLSAEVPAGAIVVDYAPQRAVLDCAALAVTHAGLNTVLEAMTRGVPMICVPVGGDQILAARSVRRLGVGEIVDLRDGAPGRIREAVIRVLSRRRYRTAAEDRRRALRAVDGAARAADVIEGALGVGAGEDAR